VRLLTATPRLPPAGFTFFEKIQPLQRLAIPCHSQTMSAKKFFISLLKATGGKLSARQCGGATGALFPKRLKIKGLEDLR